MPAPTHSPWQWPIPSKLAAGHLHRASWLQRQGWLAEVGSRTQGEAHLVCGARAGAALTNCGCAPDCTIVSRLIAGIGQGRPDGGRHCRGRRGTWRTTPAAWRSRGHPRHGGITRVAGAGVLAELLIPARSKPRRWPAGPLKAWLPPAHKLTFTSLVAIQAQVDPVAARVSNSGRQTPGRPIDSCPGDAQLGQPSLPGQGPSVGPQLCQQAAATAGPPPAGLH